MNPEKITVIIPTYGRKKVLYETIVSLNSGDIIPDEIIVVDQNFDNSFVCDLYEIKNVVIKKCCEPSSTKARNIGLMSARNEICLFCDDDILISQETLVLLLDYMRNPEIALIAATSDSNKPERKERFFKRFFSNLVSSLVGMKSLSTKGGYVVKSTMRGRYNIGDNSVLPTEWAMGYFFAIKKSFAVDNGIFWDENLYSYAYAEDLDFSIRYCIQANKSKFQTLVSSELKVIHLASTEFRISTDRQLFLYIANRYYLLHKLFPGKLLFRMRLNNFVSGLLLHNSTQLKAINRFCLSHLPLIYSGDIRKAEELFKQLRDKELE